MKKIIVLALALVVIACAFGCNKDNNATPTARVSGISNSGVATVDGLTISNKEYQTYLHNNFGDKALMALAQQKILEAWAKEEGVTPTKEQIDKEIQKLKDEGQYDEAFEQLGQDGINSLINEQLLRTNLSKKLFPPTDEELKEGYEKQFKEEYCHGPRKQTFIVLCQDKASIDEVYKGIEGLTDAKEIEKKVKELSKNYKGDKTPRTGTLWISEDAMGAPEEIVKAVKDIDVNGKTKVSEIKGGGPSIYYFAVVKKSEDKVEKKFEEVKDDVADKVALMNSMMKEDFRNALQKRTENAKIDIKIEKFKDLADLITQPAPEPMMAPAPAPAPKKK